MPAATPHPTARHWQLVGDLDLDRDQAVAVVELLAREDVGRTTLAAAGAAYQRGRRDVIRAVRAEIARPGPVESDVAFGLRLLRALDNLEAGR